MAITVLFSAKPEAWEEYAGPLIHAFKAAGLDAELSREMPVTEVDYIVFAPNGPITDFSPFTATKAVLGLWAGVESIVGNSTLTQPLVRMVDPGLTQGMVEWVTGHTLRHHLGIDRYTTGQEGVWAPHLPPLAQERPVTILGNGVLGSACGQALSRLGFPVTGWSRNAKDVPGIRCLHGASGLELALTGAQILITLLPLTKDTENLVNAVCLNQLAPSAVLINPGRGALIDDADLLSALESGQVYHATLDVFRIEPLPAAHPFWAHPHITVTPHIAADTRAKTAAGVIADNIRRSEAGEPLLNIVDRNRGY